MIELETHYARSGDVHIAYQVFGEGPIDLIFIPGFVSHLEFQWEEPMQARFFRRLASFSRLIRFDKRGCGLSDRVRTGTLEERMDDVRAVLDAVGSERAVLLGLSEGGPLSIAFAATHPERTAALILWNTFPKILQSPDYPHGIDPGLKSTFIEAYINHWGSGAFVESFVPSTAGEEGFRKWWTRFERLSMSPGGVIDTLGWISEIDVRQVLPVLRVPTLVLHSTGDRQISIKNGRYMAEHINGAKFLEMPGDDHFPWPNGDAITNEIEEFLTGARSNPEVDRVLATVLFTDIVGSTELASHIGDRAWRGILERHHALVRKELTRFRGREVNTTGDGFLATFDGPGRAVRCACSIRDEVRQLGINIRAGLHTGEVELMGNQIGGIAVHIGARVSAAALSAEVLVSNSTRDLVTGSDFQFGDRGSHVLKGVPGSWKLFAVNGHEAQQSNELRDADVEEKASGFFQKLRRSLALSKIIGTIRLPPKRDI